MAPPPDFVEPYPGWAQENKGPMIVEIIAAMTSIAFLFVVARIWSRLISLRKLETDDYIVIVCILLSISYVALAATAISYGAGRHMATLSPEDRSRAMYFTIVSFVPGITSFALPKYAVIILLARILTPGPWHKAFMWVISILYFLLSVGMLAINFAQCTPAAVQWGGAEGTCWNRRITVDYALTMGICSACFDFYLAFYPTVVLCRLLMNWRKKLGLSCALGFGYCAGAITCYKSYTLNDLISLKDFTYAVDDVVLWTNIEGNCVLIGACIPTLFPLIKKVFGASALGGSTPESSGQKPVLTIGSEVKTKKRGKGVFGLSRIDQITDENDYIILEEQPSHASTAKLRAEDLAVQQQRHQQQYAPQAKPTNESGW